MLFRLVLASGMVRGPELVRFYYRELNRPGGPRPLEQILVRHGVEARQILSLKRAYVETPDFGAALLTHVSTRVGGPARASRIEKELGACETEQLLKIRRGEPPAPIGQMLVRRGLISERELHQALELQGLMTRAERYAAEAGVDRSLAGRLAPPELRGRLPAAALVAGTILVAAVLADLWLTGALCRRADRFGAARGEEDHVRNLAGLYEGMLDEVRLGETRQAEACRGRIWEYFGQLTGAGVRLRDPRARHIQQACGDLDFGRLVAIDPRDLPRMSDEDLETALGAPEERQ